MNKKLLINTPYMPVKAIADKHDTLRKYKSEIVSLGAAVLAELNSKTIIFGEATVTNTRLFDAKNLSHCKYLNLRNSSFI